MENLLNLTNILKRDVSDKEMEPYINRILALSDAKLTEDLFVLMFYTRDIRGGKGERKLFYDLFDILNRALPLVSIEALKLVPQYGCWRDLFEMACNVPSDSPLRLKVIELAIEQVIKDESQNKDFFTPDHPFFSPQAEKPSLSLVAKWLPRESSKKLKVKALAAQLAVAMNPDSPSPKAVYRKRVSALNSVIKTLEITMCNGLWSDIKPSSVPQVALKKYAKGFLNQPVEKYGRKFPSLEPDRIVCADNFLSHLENVGNKPQHKTDKPEDLNDPRYDPVRICVGTILKRNMAPEPKSIDDTSLTKQLAIQLTNLDYNDYGGYWGC